MKIVSRIRGWFQSLSYKIKLHDLCNFEIKILQIYESLGWKLLKNKTTSLMYTGKRTNDGKEVYAVLIQGFVVWDYKSLGLYIDKDLEQVLAGSTHPIGVFLPKEKQFH